MNVYTIHVIMWAGAALLSGILLVLVPAKLLRKITSPFTFSSKGIGKIRRWHTTTDTLGNILGQTSQGSPHTVPAASKTCAGDIYINGGVLKPHGDMHGNAIGQGCCSWNEGHEIVIAGGTVLPDTSKALSKGGNPLTECVSMGIGAQGGAVSVIGGSVHIGYV